MSAEKDTNAGHGKIESAPNSKPQTPINPSFDKKQPSDQFDKADRASESKHVDADLLVKKDGKPVNEKSERIQKISYLGLIQVKAT